MTEKMLKIFISSPYRDLKEIRKLLIEEIERSLEVSAMEKFIPDDTYAQDKSLKELENSDICIFIVGDYYGTPIKKCTAQTPSCLCDEHISFTHCEYKRAVQLGKPHLTYVVTNDIAELLSDVEEDDLTSTEENELYNLLKEKGKDTSKIGSFSGYSLKEIKEFTVVANDKNKEKLEEFKKEVKTLDDVPKTHAEIKLEKRNNYFEFCKRVKKELKNAILNWHKDGRIHLKKFAGRRKELAEFLEKVYTEKSVCVVGAGGVGKTSLIQVGLLLEKPFRRKVYALLKEYSYNYTKAGYTLAKGEFTVNTFIEQLNLIDILTLVFGQESEILKKREKEQISALMKELDRQNAILFVDDLQDADDNVKDFVYRCGNNLKKGATVAGTREGIKCFSKVGPLSGLKNEELKELVTVLAETYSVRECIDDLDVWCEEIFRITQGHPMLVDIMVKNAPHFLDYHHMREIEGISDVADQKAVNEVMNRLIRDILSRKELKLLTGLSVFYKPVGREFFGEGEEKLANSIINKGLLRWDRGRLGFTFEVVRELLEGEAQEMHHERAVNHYLEEIERVREPEKPELYVEVVYHLVKEGWVEEAFELYCRMGETLEKVRKRAVAVSKLVLENIKEENKRVIVLITLGNLLSEGREFYEAEKSYVKALEIYKGLARKDPFVYDSQVANILNNLGNLYTAMGKFEKAEDHCTRALDILRELTQKDSGAHEPDLAMTLASLGNLYWNSKDFRKAEKIYMEALEIRKNLAQKDPDRYEHDVAKVLNDLGNLYISMGNLKKAEEHCTQALDILRELTRKDPDAYEPNLAMILGNLGNLYNRRTGNFKKAEKFYTKALEIYRKLTQKDPEAYEFYKAETLVNLGVLYCNLENFKKAEESYKRALVIQKKLAQKDPGAYEFRIAKVLQGLGNLYISMENLKKAEEHCTQALDILRRLTQKDPDAYEPNLALTLGDLGNLYNKLEEFEKAEESYVEALDIYKKLTQKDPDTYEPYLAMILAVCGEFYSDLKDFKKAEESYREALDAFRKLAEKDPQAYEHTAQVVLSLAILSEELQREDSCLLYFTAGAMSFNASMIYKLQSINPINCFKKAQELSSADSPLTKMATIAIISIFSIVNPQPLNDLYNLNVNDLPEICQALVTFLLKGETAQVKKPKDDIEFMFSLIYGQLRNRK